MTKNCQTAGYGPLCRRWKHHRLEFVPAKVWRRAQSPAAHHEPPRPCGPSLGTARKPPTGIAWLHHHVLTAHPARRSTNTPATPTTGDPVDVRERRPANLPGSGPHATASSRSSPMPSRAAGPAQRRHHQAILGGTPPRRLMSAADGVSTQQELALAQAPLLRLWAVLSQEQREALSTDPLLPDRNLITLQGHLREHAGGRRTRPIWLRAPAARSGAAGSRLGQIVRRRTSLQRVCLGTSRRALARVLGALTPYPLWV